MNKIVRDTYPASKLPEDLREGIDAASDVRVTVEELERPTAVLTLEEMFALRRPPYRSKEDIDEEIRQLREEWVDRG